MPTFQSHSAYRDFRRDVITKGRFAHTKAGAEFLSRFRESAQPRLTSPTRQQVLGLTPKTVEGRLRLLWDDPSPPSITVSPEPTAKRTEALPSHWVFLSGGLLGFIVGGVVAAAVLTRKK